LAAVNLRPWLTNEDYCPPPDPDPGPPDIHLPPAVPISPVEPATIAPNAVNLGVPRPVITSDAGPRIPPADAILPQPSEPPLVVPSDTTSIPTPGVPRVLVPPVPPVQTPGVGNKGRLPPPDPTVHLDTSTSPASLQVSSLVHRPNDAVPRRLLFHYPSEVAFAFQMLPLGQ
jgi:hypothetical protein